MLIREVPISEIRPAAYNPRKDLQPGDAAYDNLAKGLEKFGLVEPLVWNERSGNLVGGHQRFKILAAQQNGEGSVPVSVVDLDEIQEKALNLALNKHAGEWDYLGLAELLQEIQAAQFDLGAAGFTAADMDEIFRQQTGTGDARKLADRFMVPPFTVLNAREGWWQERKAAWLALGIQSELGRGESAVPAGSLMPAVSRKTGKIVRSDSRARPIE